MKELNHGTKLGFDKFARLATLVCDTEICIVNFLDDKIQYTSAEDSAKLWLKHKAVGKPLTLCAHTILRRSAEIFEIPDTTKDWRFNGKVVTSLNVLICSLLLLGNRTFDSMPAHHFVQELGIILVPSVSSITSQNDLPNSKHLLSRTLPI